VVGWAGTASSRIYWSPTRLIGLATGCLFLIGGGASGGVVGLADWLVWGRRSLIGPQGAVTADLRRLLSVLMAWAVIGCLFNLGGLWLACGSGGGGWLSECGLVGCLVCCLVWLAGIACIC